MAIERDAGPGGISDLPPELVEEIVPVLAEGMSADNVYEFDDGSALVGEYQEEVVVQQAPFDGNLADFTDDAELGMISSELTGDINDDFSSRGGS